MIKMVIFDLDGTLVDSLTDLALNVNRGLRAVGLPEHPVERYRTFVGNGRAMLVRRAMGDAADDSEKFDRVTEVFNREYALHCHDNTAAYPGCGALLDGLAAHGILTAVLYLCRGVGSKARVSLQARRRRAACDIGAARRRAGGVRLCRRQRRGRVHRAKRRHADGRRELGLSRQGGAAKRRCAVCCRHGSRAAGIFGAPMNKMNYQRELDRVIAQHQRAGEVPKLLLHVCCAPYISPTILTSRSTTTIRISRSKRNMHTGCARKNGLLRKRRLSIPSGSPRAPTIPRSFLPRSRAWSRSRRAACGVGSAFGCGSGRPPKRQRSWALTTLPTISPLKNAALLNEIGAEMGAAYGVPWLWSDFKKREGYKRSIELSREYDLYRQNYCGCVFSRRSGDRK